MKTFKILNHTVSFDDGLNDYIQIMQYAQSYKLTFHERYISKPQNPMTSLEDFVLYVQELYNNGFAREYMKLSEEIVNLYIKYGIYDMSKEIVEIKNTRFLSAHLEKLSYILEEIETFLSQAKQGMIDIEAKWKNIVEEAVPGNYFTVYSSSYSDILLNDYFNHKEEKRVAKKRQRLYDENVGKTTNDFLSQIIPLCREYINKIQNLIYEDFMQTIDDMYKNCAMDLFAKGKISSFIQYTDNSNSDGILNNINKITSSEVIAEQLSHLLQIDSFNQLVHYKIIEYITANDIPQYVEIVKFFRFENMIFYFYVENSAKGEQKNKVFNNNCLAILRAVKDTLNMGIVSKDTNSFSYTDDAFPVTIVALKTYFECIKNIFGFDDKFINEKEQSMFITAIKEASKGTNLVYDGSIMNLDYNYLYEFWYKAKKQRESTAKRQEFVQNILSSLINWAKNHILFIVIIIILIILSMFD